MFKLSVRSLLAHKIRFFMTSFAVVLGVSFVVGALVVTDTVRHSFDTLFAEINQGIDLEVRSESAFADDPGNADRDPLPASLVDTVRAVDGVSRGRGRRLRYRPAHRSRRRPGHHHRRPADRHQLGTDRPALAGHARVGPQARTG